jgi:hypothetical protein
MRDRVEPIARGHGKAREGLFVAVLCSSHEIGVHAAFRFRPTFAEGLHPIWAAGRWKGLNLRPLRKCDGGAN